jgi:hypothetical protein
MNGANPKERHQVTIYHALHRSGGTLVGRCFGSLPGVTLLSEINPGSGVAGVRILEPAYQAFFWQKLFDDQVAEAVGQLPFDEQIEVIRDKCLARGDRLLIRDWPYIDFFAQSRFWHQKPTGRLSLVEQLENRFELRRIAVVRHPLDQWMSWLNYQGAADARAFGFENFLTAVKQFAEATLDIPHFRYEKFVDAAAQTMKSMCEELGLPYNAVFLQRFRDYRQITGDALEPPYVTPSIEPRHGRSIPAEWLALAEANTNYRFILDAWGYEHPQVSA